MRVVGSVVMVVSLLAFTEFMAYVSLLGWQRHDWLLMGVPVVVSIAQFLLLKELLQRIWSKE